MDFQENERRWAQELLSCSLVVELQYEDEVATKTLQRIGYLIGRGDGYAVETGYLASLLIGLNYVASAEAKRGEMWPQIMAALDNLPNTQANQERITSLHRNALSRFGLQRFEHPLGRIGEMQIHAGIPIKSQDSFIRKLTKGYRTEQDFNAALFNEQVRALPESMVQGKGLDKPTWHFINQAGAVADDFVAKCIEVLDDMQDGTYDQDGGRGLPPRIIDKIVKVVSEQGTVSRAKGSRVKQPKIVWERDVSGQIGVSLPPMPEHENSGTVWRFEFSEKSDERSIGMTLPGLQPTQTFYPLREVAPSVSAKASVFFGAEPLVRAWNLSLFQEDVPVLIFTADGSLDRQKGPLEPELYRILVPRNNKGVQSRIEIDGVAASNRIDCPLGWGESAQGGAWDAYEVYLSGADNLKAFVGNDRNPVVTRSVSVLRKPTVSASFPVDGVFDNDNNQIYSDLPRIAVPNNGNPLWLCEVRNADNRVVFSEEIEASENEIWLEASTELEGRFELQVTQGFGSTLRLPLTLIPGLTSDLAGLMRMLSEESSGLSQVTVSLQRNGQVETFELSSNEISKRISDTGLSSIPFIVRPNYERFELLNSRSLKASEWITPTKTHIEDLPELQFLANISSPNGAELVALWPDRTVVPLRSGNSVSRLRFNLAELTETANQKGAFELILKTQDNRNLKAGNCFPRKMFSSFEFDSETQLVKIIFPGGNLPADLEICFYAVRAPWVKPVASPLSSTSMKVPEDVIGFGDIQFTIALSDPWVVSNFSDTPDLDSPNTGTISLPKADPTLSPDHALAFWLATGDRPSQASNISIERAWQCLLLDSFKSGSTVNRNAMREFAGAILQASPAEALESYPDGLRSDESYLKHLITTDLVSIPAADTKRGVADFAGKPFLACLLTSAKNNELFDELEQLSVSFWGLQQPPKTRESETVATDQEESTVPNDELLLRKAGLLAPVPALYAGFDDDGLQSLLDQYLPGSLLEGGTVAKIMQSLAFSTDRATDHIDPKAIQNALSDLGWMEAEIGGVYEVMSGTRALATRETRDVVRKTRGARILTLDIPAVSIRLATVARLKARGHIFASGVWPKCKSALQQISTAYPDLMELDLTIVELYLKFRERQRK
jgi:hypothetical protein